MTRINIGINPKELCDQMLLAEYRELPRMRQFALDRKSKYDGYGPRPTQFTLGSGHMSYFLPFGGWLKDRWHSIVIEMLKRGFRADFEWQDYPFNDGMPDESARPLLQERIILRLSQMKRKPTWTNRDSPDWALSEQVYSNCA